MKTLLFLLALLCAFNFSYAQNTAWPGPTANTNVGIGTASPTARLTLGGGGTLNPNTGPELDYSGLNLTFKGESLGQSFNLGSIKMVQPTGYYLDAADMVFSTCVVNSSEKMRITANGNVSIGTTDAKGYKLAVNGDAIATSMTVKLYANWPDYVFKPSYHLPSLSEVKTYIDQNQHLPEMPSEQDVSKNGINLGEMVKLQTKKIEELTLYLIDLKTEKDKQDKEQQDQIDHLKQQLEALTASHRN